MTALTIGMLSIFAVFAAYAVVAPLFLNLSRFWGPVAVKCPEQHSGAAVRLKATAAALSSAYGPPQPQVRRCTLLRPGNTCGESCLKGLSW